MDAAASMNSIIDTRVADNSNTNDGNGTIGDTGDDASQRPNVDLGSHRWRGHRGRSSQVHSSSPEETVKAAKARLGLLDPDAAEAHPPL